jgi:hypothetical protein
LVEAEDLGSMSLLALMTTHHCRQTWRRNKEDIAGNRPTIILSIRQRDMRVEYGGWSVFMWLVFCAEIRGMLLLSSSGRSSGRWSHASSR